MLGVLDVNVYLSASKMDCPRARSRIDNDVFVENLQRMHSTSASWANISVKEFGWFFRARVVFSFREFRWQARCAMGRFTRSRKLQTCSLLLVWGAWETRMSRVIRWAPLRRKIWHMPGKLSICLPNRAIRHSGLSISIPPCSKYPRGSSLVTDEKPHDVGGDATGSRTAGPTTIFFSSHRERLQ